MRQLLRAMQRKKVVYLIGTPGVGKTLLGAVLACMLLCLGFKLIYLTYRLGEVYTAYLLQQHQAPRVTNNILDFERELREGSLHVYIVDGGRPILEPNMSCPTVVFTSPGKKGIKDLRKNFRQKFFMYTWTRQELERCRSQLPMYDTVPVGLLQQLYEVRRDGTCDGCMFLVALAP